MQRLPIISLIFFVLLSCSTSSFKTDVFIDDATETSKSDWVFYDKAKKQVSFHLIATENANNNGFNYNGYYGGNITLKVPIDWQVNITLTNEDASSTHDLILTKEFEKENIPDSLTGESSSIKRAYISPLFSGETDSLRFITKKGHYWLFCGVKGHGIEGMWIEFESNENVQIPIIEIKN